MQRTILTAGQNYNTTATGGASALSYYGAMGGGNPVNLSDSPTLGNVPSWSNQTYGIGGYGESAFAAVYSRLYMVIGKVQGATTTLTANINVAGSINGGTTGQGAGHLTCMGGGAQTNSGSYVYDATDIDAITAGQGCGFMNTVSASSGYVVMPALGVACDTLGQGYCSPFMQSQNGQVPGIIYNNASDLTHLVGPTGFIRTGVGTAQDFNPMAYVAMWLQWQNQFGNTEAANACTCTFSTSPTYNSTGSSGPSATIGSASFVGLMHDTTDIKAVPAGSYSNFAWTGTTQQNTIWLANAGIHMVAAGSNSCTLYSGANSTADATTTPGYSPFGQVRNDSVLGEVVAPVPTSGVFSNLYVNVTGYTASASFTFQTGAGTGDTGGGSGSIPNPLTSTSLLATGSAIGWWFDATDIVAVTPTTLYAIEVTGTASPAATYQAQAINFTAPAHLGLTTRGAG